MIKIIKIKYFIYGLIVGLLFISIGTYAYVTQPGKIGSLFKEISTDTYKLKGDEIEDNTIDNTEIQYDDIYTIKQLGIGTTSPKSKLNIIGGEDAALDKNGYIMLGSEDSTNVIIDNNEIMARNNGSTSPLYIQMEGGNTLFNKNGGYVGIGTTSPSQKLDVVGNIEVSGGDYILKDNNGDWSIGGNSENLEFREPEDGNKLWMHFQDDKGLQIDAGGAVKATCIGNCF